ncbi:hypothetical protein KUTeg_017560 [Tegillarca granosa]|uniref:Solute carrier family 12 member 2 n=1 Tax=Tegillarca granosa TaxID=220873 RepID=A0ABQ9EJ57_TEGGR|nr:hypothetical protein KUTeg_017560 [Tegillarca granosa]
MPISIEIIRVFYPTYDYRQRPTLEQLRDGKRTAPVSSVTEDLLAEDLKDSPDEEAGIKKSTTSVLKFGWIQGVLIRCLLNIFGVMLFLRLTWVTGQAGIGLASVVVLLSAFVTTITTMSMSAICTNGEVQGGGAYYMISRSLGPEFGGSIGVVFALANAIAAAMYVVGFAETVRDIMWEYGAFITGDSLHEVRIIGCATSVLLIGIVIIGMEWEAKAQLGLLVILIAAIVNFFVGTFIPPTDEQKSKGVVGYRYDVFSENLGPDFRNGESFFSVFSIFFPAATGILAGANISGDLKNPQAAIPKGTFLAIFLTTVIYLGMVWAAGGCLLRDAVGPVLFSAGNASTIVIPPTNMSNISSTESILQILPITVDSISNCDVNNGTCDYGLMNDNSIVGTASAFRPLILAGIFSATLSSALASLVGAPKVFQALGKDKLFPYLEFFSKSYGVNGEPRRGYLLAFVICLAMTCIGALDVIAPIISNFFLMAYALINFSCFRASVADSPGFRPAFKYYNQWISLLGSLACVAVMFLINWWAALVTFVVVALLYTYIKTKGPDVNWGSSAQAQAYRTALTTTLKLVNVEEHVKNFRPQILVMSGYPRNRPALMDFVSSITKKQSLLISGHIFTGLMSDHVQHLRSNAAYKWMNNRNIKAFYNSVVAPTFRIGTQVLMQISLCDKNAPNNTNQNFTRNMDAFDLKFGVGILRVPEGFDVNRVPDDLIDASEENETDDEYDADSEEEVFVE